MITGNRWRERPKSRRVRPFANLAIYKIGFWAICTASECVAMASGATKTCGRSRALPRRARGPLLGS
jgi:hypothetical protein